MAHSVEGLWLGDSGANCHMTHDRSCFETFEEVSNHPGIGTANQVAVPVKGRGTVRIKFFANGQWWNGKLYDVLYVPGLRKNLFSLTKCAEAGYKIVMKKREILIEKPDGQVILTGVIDNGLPRMLMQVINND